MSEVLKFRLNITEELHLAFGTGRQCSGIRGPQFLYTLMDRSSIAFADPILDAQIQALQPKAGARVGVTMRPGNQWEVKLLNPPTEQPKPAILPKPAAAAQQQSIQHSNGNSQVQGPAIPVNGQGWTALRMALFSAIDDAAEAEKYAAGKGMSIRFEAVDIRTMANTTAIGMQERR
jgi:hypothetical protein